MVSKYQEFSDDVVCSGNDADNDRRGHVSDDAASAAAAAGDVIQPSTSVTVTPSTQPVIIVQAPKLQRSFERYPSKAAVVLGSIQVCHDRPILLFCCCKASECVCFFLNYYIPVNIHCMLTQDLAFVAYYSYSYVTVWSGVMQCCTGN